MGPGKMIENYLHDVGFQLRNSALEVRKNLDAAVADEEKRFLEGKLLAYNEVISLLISQARSFDLSPSLLALDGFDPDSDL
jgi:hypothetical protein